ncbi:cysteine dioxygenase [Streptomyces sp. NPDC056638]|uniref:cysteine dioxygenase family protein n=1 Tax=Streptomyces sp. NPDC056638 TaxID=3345887 RepID=UPI0036B7ECFC
MTPLLAELAAAIRTAIRTAPTDPAQRACRVADTLARYLGHPGLLAPAQLQPDPTAYRQHLLHAEPDGSFSLVALVWLPGQTTPVHDHTAWCVVGTHIGAEEETVYTLTTDHAGRTALLPTATTTYPAGSVTFVTPPGDIHHVRNATTATTVSLHVYGTDIRPSGTSIRRTYDHPALTAPAAG